MCGVRPLTHARFVSAINMLASCMYCLERENVGLEKEESESKRIDVDLREHSRIENRKRYKGGASALG